MKQTFPSNTPDENYSRKPRSDKDTEALKKSVGFTPKEKK